MNLRRNRTSGVLRNVCESLEARRLLFNTYVGQGDPNGVWGTSYLSYSYSNFFDGWANLPFVDMQNTIEEAMGVWTAVTPLRFFSRPDSGPAPSDSLYDAGTNPTIRWGHHFIDGNVGVNVAAHAYRPGTNGRNGDVHFDDSNTWTVNGLLQTAAHEFGHSIGLDHPNGEVVNGVSPPAFPAIMHALLGGNGTWNYSGLESAFLLADDVAGIQSLYGNGLGYVIDGFGELNVYGTGVDDLITVDYFNGNLIVTSSNLDGSNSRSFARPLNDGVSTVNTIQLHGSAGNDIMRVVNSNGLRVNAYGGGGNDILDLGWASNNLNGTGEAQFFAGDGNDSLFAYDGNNNSGATYNVTSTRFDRTGWGGARFFDDLENRTLTTGNTANTVNIFNTSSGRPTTINNGGGLDVVNLGTSNSLQQIQGNVTIQNDPNFTILNLNNSADSVARTLVISQTAGNLGQLTGLAPGAFLWDNSDINSINITTGTNADAINVFGVSEVMKITNAGGRDTVAVGSSINGMQDITGNLTINAFFGVDQPMVLNDANSSTARAVTMTASGIDYVISGLAGGTVTYRDFGAVSIYLGTGSDAFTFNASVFHRLNVFGGNGSDAFLWNAVNNYSEGLGGTFVSAVNIDGGGAYNTLSINDAARTLATTYQLFPERFLSRDPSPFGVGADFLYDNMQAIGITCNNLDNRFAVYGISSDIDVGNQVTILLGGGVDIVDIAPHDAAGNLTINGNLGIGGGTGSDLIRVQDATSALPIHYAFSNPFGSSTQNVYGLGTSGLGTGEIESWEIYAGTGNDTFDMNQWTSGRSLGIYGGAGNDVLNFGNNNLAGLITSISAFGFDGQDGYDTWNLLNADASGNWTYTRGENFVGASRTSPSYTLAMSEARVEDVVFIAGSGNDLVQGYTVASGSRLFVYSGAGFDQLVLGNPNFSAENIQGPVYFNAEADGGFVVVNDQTDTTGDTFHLTQNTLDAYPNDDLFGPGGELTFQDLSNNGSTSGMYLNLGSGSDVAYAQPLLNAATVIQFNGQNGAAPEGGGDVLNLALAGVSDYVITGNTSGNVTSSSHNPLLWFGAEVAPLVDDIAPEPTGGAFVYDASAQAIDFTFTEDVSLSYLPAYLYLTNVTEGFDIVPSDMAMVWDAGTNAAHITFPGLPNGALPNGDYHVNLTAGYIDVFGNASTIPLEFDFFILAGDTNHDRSVDFDDLLTLAQNYGQSGMTFSQGDFNYDGTVDFDDLLALAQNYGTTLFASGDSIRNDAVAPFSDALAIVTETRTKSRSRLSSRAVSAVL